MGSLWYGTRNRNREGEGEVLCEAMLCKLGTVFSQLLYSSSVPLPIICEHVMDVSPPHICICIWSMRVVCSGTQKYQDPRQGRLTIKRFKELYIIEHLPCRYYLYISSKTIFNFGYVDFCWPSYEKKCKKYSFREWSELISRRRSRIPVSPMRSAGLFSLAPMRSYWIQVSFFRDFHPWLHAMQ